MRARAVWEFPIVPEVSRDGSIFTIAAVEQLAEQMRERGDVEVAPGVRFCGETVEISLVHASHGFVEIVYSVESEEPFDALLGSELSFVPAVDE